MASETTKVVPLTCHGHSRPVTHLSFSSITDDDQYYLISACKDNNPMLRDGITGDWIGTFIGHKGAVWQARLSSDATLAATASADFTAKIWDTFTGEALHTLQHNHIVRAVAFPNHPHPQFLATGGAEKKLRVFDLSRSSGTHAASSSPTRASNGVTNGASSSPSSAPSATPQSYEVGPGVHQGTIKSIIWSSTDSNTLITAADDKQIRWWDLRARNPTSSYTVSGQIGSCELNAYQPSPSASSPALPSSPSTSNPGTLTVSAGSSLYFFPQSTPGTPPIKTITLPYEPASVALHNDGKSFVTGSAGDTWVRVYDFETERELEVGKGHHGPVWSVSFSPDGKIYATGSEDGTIKLWKHTNGAYGLWR